MNFFRYCSTNLSLSSQRYVEEPQVAKAVAILNRKMELMQNKCVVCALFVVYMGQICLYKLLGLWVINSGSHSMGVLRRIWPRLRTYFSMKI